MNDSARDLEHLAVDEAIFDSHEDEVLVRYPIDSHHLPWRLIISPDGNGVIGRLAVIRRRRV